VKLGQELAAAGEQETKKILDPMKALIEKEPLARIDYVKAVDGLTMQQIEKVQKPMLVALAVYIGKTRLIDNFSVDE
jgi:pantoate--beta-alanine ligase